MAGMQVLGVKSVCVRIHNVSFAEDRYDQRYVISRLASTQALFRSRYEVTRDTLLHIHTIIDEETRNSLPMTSHPPSAGFRKSRSHHARAWHLVHHVGPRTQ